ncbi:MAG: pyruvate, phosphate dikinase [Candidatus Nanopelagicales bacterium]|nr:pyruvate, phosphate dikinase [Candidatus Nanopelagicales bacterium]
MVRYVYDFAEGDKDQKDLLGGKGANLAEMIRLGLNVPPGFTVTTEACRAYLASGAVPTEMAEQVTEQLRILEGKIGRTLGDPEEPLLVSVRSGAKFSMPGMMETVLNIGTNDASVHGLAVFSGDERFAWDSYRRLIQMFGKTVLGIEGHFFEHAIDEAKTSAGVTTDIELGVDDLKALVDTYKGIVREHAGIEFPQDTREQLDMAIKAVFDSWNTDRAVLYRRQERIPADLGTAVNVQAMVFGNVGDDSGTGVAFTRDPATGATGHYGDYLPDAQGEDVVAGIRNTLTLDDMGRLDPEAHAELLANMDLLEKHYKDLCDIEFTVENGRLYMLQTRVGKRTAGAAFRIATQLVDEGIIDTDEAVRRVSGAQLVQLMFPHFDHSGDRTLVAKGIAASPGAAVGVAVFDSETAVEKAEQGIKTILVRRETTPDDLAGMVAAAGILTSRGGKTSHAAVVARGMGKTAVCGTEDLAVDTTAKQATAPGGIVIREGDPLSIDGATGEVFVGEVPVIPSPVVQYFEGELSPDGDDDLVRSVHRIITHADDVRRLRVRTNADTPEDSARARRMGADFEEILEAMDGLPVTIRLLDPPLHEFLPDLTSLSVAVARAEERGDVKADDLRLLAAVERLHESNPMLGLRGVRLGLAIPGLFGLQVRAIAQAAAARKAAGGDPRAEIMIPLVGAVQELELIKDEAEQVIAEVAAETGSELAFQIGTMIELPRAAMTADQIAEAAEFFSFGTNDLTQTTWGFSRDDVEGAFFTTYLEKGVFGVSPFESIDRDGVGALVRVATEKGRATRPDIKLGVCGEHGGDPESVHFFDEVGLDYVSCSPFRVPVARLEAGRATLFKAGGGSDSR